MSDGIERRAQSAAEHCEGGRRVAKPLFKAGDAISPLREPLFSPFDQVSVPSELEDISLAHASPTGKSNAPERLAYCAIVSRNSGVQP